MYIYIYIYIYILCIQCIHKYIEDLVNTNLFKDIKEDKKNLIDIYNNNIQTGQYINIEIYLL